MRLDLSDQPDPDSSGALTGPDGRLYHRRTTRMKRRDADALVVAGTPVVAYSWAGGQLDWCDGAEATSTWQQARRTHTLRPAARGDLEWTAGLWEADNGDALLVLTGHC